MPEKYFSRGAELSMAENIYYGNKSEIKEMVNNGRVDINTPGKYGFTYLMYAIYIQKYDMAKLLLKLGADPNLLSFVNHPVKGNNPDYIQREEGTFRLMPLSFVCGHPGCFLQLLEKQQPDCNLSFYRLPLCLSIQTYSCRIENGE